ncbi:hypothetical protein [uncultured Litoreibacter sp.]|uniref:hypothetical protein n=1 Tax=uncultured Litoreibacter sp. TaxID=1392394 RepID=UPI00262C1C26|nr:hypothetical protein [uncultured Litoreibacter sp.]
MFLRKLAVVLILPLSACLDVETDVKIGEDEVITTATTMTLGRQLFDMVQAMGPQAGALCPADSVRVESPETVSCKINETLTVDEAIAEAAAAKSEDPFLGEMELVRLDEERLKISVPLDFEKIEGMPAELSTDNPMFSLIADGLAESEIVVRLRALEIESTNGAVSDDGTTVELVIPTLEILQPSGTLPETFDAVVKYRSCGLFGC